MGSDAKDLVKHTKLFIDGRFVDAVSGKTFSTFNPSNSECIAQVAEGDAADVDLAVRAAREAFDHGPWPRLAAAERGRILYKFADVIEEHLDELATLETLNNGMLIDLSKGIIAGSVASLRYNAGWADKLNGKTLRTDSTRMCYTLLEPIGVVGAIVPWNFPAYLFLNKVGSALTCGNTIVVKVAEQTPLTGLLLASLSQEAGIPAGVLNVIPGYGPTAGAAISKHMSVDKVTFTGSTEVGRMIMESAARSNLKPVTLELGGKSPFIICEDADLDSAVAVSQDAIFMHQGQVCVAASRVFVHESIHDEFIKRSVKLASERVIGDPFQSGVQNGPQINQEQLDRVLSYIESGKKEGASLLVGGKRIGEKGFYIQPTIFGDVKQSMKIASEEIFGPVLSVLKFKTLDEAVELANSTHYGLAAAVFSKNIDTVNLLTRSIKSGVVYVNCYLGDGPAVPFGGYKMSGIGRENGYEGLLPYLQHKSILMPMENSPWN
ncbi:hypothetical protein SELMODRAFT_235150 [Selaginella moellendorffii]|uniref:Aldehyde dehydrogenase domain-containing protein n=1 Tax=Selaginella moellendorffii TaxID=88036 RepID=D8SUF8_SELML|nr:aldehyde dehydrogenase family 2 member B7, mitochondrial [Selaginella moellendorffii]EFJ12064.1 hypothetical protein SELMODRAFT_235150 [Selaginella moellendorffii]|eukprot:XP_002986982.1 aldehyde dehydrogenase family 2 member B7, mitochondrial [Selaginella moellendorffii]